VIFGALAKHHLKLLMDHSMNPTRVSIAILSGAVLLSGLVLFSASDVRDWTAPLKTEAERLGKASWHPMLKHLAEMHAHSTHAPAAAFEFPWEDTGTGYGLGPAFGHWDLVHEVLDVLPAVPEHAREELLNDVRLQLASGLLPGLYWMNPAANAGLRARFDPNNSHPPVWVVAAGEYLTRTGDQNLAREFFGHATRQLKWFESSRKATPGGYLYHDILMPKWESGVDEGVRFDDRAKVKTNACVDATSQVYQLATYAATWATLIGEDPAPWTARANRLRDFIETKLWSEDDGFFFDSWAIEQPELKHQAFEGMWPVVVGAASPAQAQRVIDGWLLRSDRFFSEHPIATVGVRDPKFERRMWRGPAWNSMTYWAALGCVRYGRKDGARKLLEAALDDTAAQFARTGTIWEFYDPQGRHPEDVARKPQTKRNQPFTEYLGHNPLFAMARLWQQLASTPK